MWDQGVQCVATLGPWFDQLCAWFAIWSHDLNVFIRHVLQEHGYWAYLILFIGTFLEGETILIIVAAFAHVAATHHNPHPNIILCILSAFAGSLGGDQTWFYIGRHKGKAFLARRPTWQKRSQRITRLLEVHQTWLLLCFRFLYGLRNATPFMVGMSEIKASRFLILNALGAAIWAVAFGVAGYLFGNVVEQLIEHYRLLVLAAFGALILLIWLTKTLLNRRRNRRELEAIQHPHEGPNPPPPQGP